MSQHTPGPWKIAPGRFIVAKCLTNDPATGQIVAEVPCQGGNLADLRLIAAAPEMYEMVKRLEQLSMPVTEGNSEGEWALAILREFVIKARDLTKGLA